MRRHPMLRAFISTYCWSMHKCLLLDVSTRIEPVDELVGAPADEVAVGEAVDGEADS